MTNRRQQGITLLSLIFALIIVAVVASIATAAYTGYVQQSRLKKVEGSLVVVQNAIRNFGEDQNTYAGICNAASVLVIQVPGKDSNFTYQCLSTPTATKYSVGAVGVCPGRFCGLTLAFSYLGPSKGYEESTPSVPTGWNKPTKTCWIAGSDGTCSTAQF